MARTSCYLNPFFKWMFREEYWTVYLIFLLWWNIFIWQDISKYQNKRNRLREFITYILIWKRPVFQALNLKEPQKASRKSQAGWACWLGCRWDLKWGVLDELCAVGEDTATIWRDWFLVSGKEEFEHLHGCRSWQERLLKYCRLIQLRWLSHTAWVPQFNEVSLSSSPPPVGSGAWAELGIPYSSMVSRGACSSHGWWLEQVLRAAGLRVELPISVFPTTHRLGSLLKVLLQLFTGSLPLRGQWDPATSQLVKASHFLWGISLSSCTEMPAGGSSWRLEMSSMAEDLGPRFSACPLLPWGPANTTQGGVVLWATPGCYAEY